MEKFRYLEQPWQVEFLLRKKLIRNWIQQMVASILISEILKINVYETINLPVYCMDVKLGRWLEGGT